MEHAILDFDILMDRLGVGFAPRESHGEIVNIPDWTVPQCLEALRIVETEILPQGKPVLMKKHPARWIYCSIIRRILKLGVWIEQHDGSTAQVKPPVIGDGSTFRFHNTETGDQLYIQYCIPGADNIQRDYAINFTNLSEVILPPMPSGKHLFIQTLGSSAVPVGMCLAYGDEAASIWIAEPGEDCYMCAVSNCGDCSIGDVRQMERSC